MYILAAEDETRALLTMPLAHPWLALLSLPLFSSGITLSSCSSSDDFLVHFCQQSGSEMCRPFSAVSPAHSQREHLMSSWSLMGPSPARRQEEWQECLQASLCSRSGRALQDLPG